MRNQSNVLAQVFAKFAGNRFLPLAGIVLLVFSGSISCASSERKDSPEGQEGATERNMQTSEFGCIKGNCQDGTGTYRYETDDVYEGGFQNGLRHGEGTFTYANGDVYRGMYSEGMRNGRGVYTFANGDKYDGSFKNGVREGDGIYTFASDGNIFRGQFVQDGQSGEGVLVESEASRNCELDAKKVLCEKGARSETDQEDQRRLQEPQQDDSAARQNFGMAALAI
ncbi:MAG: hypothetical protein KDK27_09465 [Leptospiraceae bacterium]|nr:hypothetical protein [Leptospiraceae bacterium]